MKKLLSVLLAVVIMCVSCVAIADIITIDTETATDEEINEASAQLKAVIIERNGGIEPGLTLENYNRIEEGMTYEEVVKLFGEPGTVEMEFDFGWDEGKTISYAWGNGVSYVGINFTGNKVTTKMQFGLK